MKFNLYRNICTGILVAQLSVGVLAAENKVLFIGNSFTIGGGVGKSVPDLFDALARAGGHSDPVTVMQAEGGKDFQYHYENSQDVINQEDWTHVVLQNYSTEPTRMGSVTDHMNYGQLLYESVMANHSATQVLLYQTWARSAIHSMISGTSTAGSYATTDEMLDELKENYQALADSLNQSNPENSPVLVSPVGEAWSQAGGNLHPSDPKYIDLFTTDEYHGNYLGYYLSACVHYAVIYEESPEGLYATPELSAVSLGLSQDHAAFVEMIAWQTVLAKGLVEAVPNMKAPVWSSLAQSDTHTLILRFDEPIDTSVATDPLNFRVVNQGNFIDVEKIEYTSFGAVLSLTTETALQGNVVVQIGSNLVDHDGNMPVVTRRVIEGLSAPGIIYIDFGGANLVANDVNQWNTVSLDAGVRNAVGNGTGAPQVLIQNLVDATGEKTGVSFSMSDALAGTNSYGSMDGPYPGGATSDSLFGQQGSYNGFQDNGQAVFIFDDLDPFTTYTFTFYASRQDTPENRESQYTLSGANVGTVALNPGNNVSKTVELTNVQPDASGKVTLTVAPGPNNSNSVKYYHLGLVVLQSNQSVSGPVLFRPVLLGNEYVIDWRGEGSLYHSENLSRWTPYSPQPKAPHLEAVNGLGSRFYLIATQ